MTHDLPVFTKLVSQRAKVRPRTATLDSPGFFIYHMNKEFGVNPVSIWNTFKVFELGDGMASVN